MCGLMSHATVARARAVLRSAGRSARRHGFCSVEIIADRQALFGQPSISMQGSALRVPA